MEILENKDPFPEGIQKVVVVVVVEEEGRKIQGHKDLSHQQIQMALLVVAAVEDRMEIPD